MTRPVNIPSYLLTRKKNSRFHWGLKTRAMRTGKAVLFEIWLANNRQLYWRYVLPNGSLVALQSSRYEKSA